jgi:predicted porin
MLYSNMARPMRAVLLACACVVGFIAFDGPVHADDAQDNAALREQLRIMMQRMDDMQKQIQALSNKAAAPPVVTTPAPVEPGETQGPMAAKMVPSEPKFEKFLKGFYGTLDVSLDDATKGIRGLTAYSYSYAGAGPGTGYVNNGPKGTQITGSVGWIGDLSTNKSVLGYRGSHDIAGSEISFIYQIETQPAITSSPGLNTSYTQQSNVTKAGIGYGDTFVGLADNTWGKLKIGTTYAPYKKATDRMNPFSGMLGDYASIMGNTGGDNRVEFGTRLDHSIWFESPKILNMFSFDALISPGANRTYDNVVQSSGSPDCSGGNTPGSGNLPQNCDDGGFGTAYSADLKFETGGLYATVAWELHHDVNRNSDGIGANSPYYGYLVGLGSGVSPLLDWGTYNGYATEYGAAFVAANGFTPPYLTDIADEWAIKGGVQYTFDFGLSLSGIYEWMKRSVPADLQFQNERTRMGTWFAASYDFSPRDNLSFGWAHAGATPGDPGGQHNYNPTNSQNQANMYTIALKHHFDENFYAYVDAADTVNDGNAHYDIGAGGRGVTTDCHDGTNTVFTDYSSAGPTTWGGCHIMGVSLGLDYKF